MEEKEFDLKGLFKFMNSQEGEFLIRVERKEGGEHFGETDECCLSETN